LYPRRQSRRQPYLYYFIYNIYIIYFIYNIYYIYLYYLLYNKEGVDCLYKLNLLLFSVPRLRRRPIFVFKRGFAGREAAVTSKD